MSTAAFREVTADRAEEFARKGHKRRHFFAHRIRHLQKCGPDAYRLGLWQLDEREPERHWELVLYAAGALVDEFPADLYFDDDVNWHRQQFGRRGQVATANLVLSDGVVHCTVLVSDLVQRIARRREHKTQVEKRFAGWPHMLLNAVLDFAHGRGAHTLRLATADRAVEHTDPMRDVGREIYERIYDRPVQAFSPGPVEDGWWPVPVDPERIVAPERGSEPLAGGPVICVCHDVEAGFGHEDWDPDFADVAHGTWRQGLQDMLAVEARAGVRATYNVLGLLFEEVRAELEAAGHAVGFHSYDHRIEAPQLNECRELDYRVKGYRPPRSILTPELTSENLLFHNFEWLAGAPEERPRLVGGIVRIPVVVDDYALYKEQMPYEAWEAMVFETLAGAEFGAVGLHDCYAPLWLPRYAALLDKLASLGRLATLDEVAAEVTLAGAA